MRACLALLLLTAGGSTLLTAGCAYYRTEEEEVEAHYQQARHLMSRGGDLERALELLDRAIELRGDRSEIFQTRGGLHRDAGRLELARNDYAEAARLNGGGPADLLVRLGTMEGELGYLDRAETALAEAIRRDPEQPEAWLQRARFRRLAGRHEEAEKDVEAARARGLHWAEPFHNEGVRLLRMQRPMEAERWFRFATEIDPLRPESWMGLGRTLLETRRPAPAAAAFAEAAALRKTDPEAFFHRGNALLAAGRHEEALAAYDRAVELDATKPAYFTGRGMVYQQEYRDPARAGAEYGRALKLDPEHPLALLNRAILYHELGRHEEAEADLRRSLARRGSTDGARLLASILNEQGKHDAAINVCLRALELCKDPAVREALDDELQRALTRRENPR